MHHTTPEDLYDRLSASGVTGRSHQTYLLRALHLLGNILYFDDDEELRDTIILRPQWVNGQIAKVLDSLEVADKHGLLTRAHERQLWSDLNPGLRDRFLRMMEKFDLSYRITDDATAASLVVERLPWDNPPYHARWDAALSEPGAREIRLRYQLNTLPPGVPTWFIAREHRFSTGTQWRNGALLRHAGDPRVLGLIRAERQDKTVDLTVRGPVPQLFFSVLQDGFESTLRHYQGLEIIRMVPCTCANGDGTHPGQPCAHLYQYGPLLRRVEQGVLDVECELSFSKVSVAELLFGIAPTTTDQLVRRLDNIDQQLADFGAESAWANREFLKAIHRAQAKSEAVCPSVFTLVPATGRSHGPGIRRLELRLYCEQPGGFHALPELPYIISQPTRRLAAISPYLIALVRMLKHAAPLVGPVLGLASDHLANQLTNETRLMTELVSKLPAPEGFVPGPFQVNDPQHIELDVDYRALHAMLHELDPGGRWAGLGRIFTPEGRSSGSAAITHSSTPPDDQVVAVEVHHGRFRGRWPRMSATPPGRDGGCAVRDAARGPAARRHLHHHPAPALRTVPRRLQLQPPGAGLMRPPGQEQTAMPAEGGHGRRHRAALSALTGICRSASSARSSFGSRPSVVR